MIPLVLCPMMKIKMALFWKYLPICLFAGQGQDVWLSGHENWGQDCENQSAPLVSLSAGNMKRIETLPPFISFLELEHCFHHHVFPNNPKRNWFKFLCLRKLEIVRDDAASNASSGSSSIFYKGLSIRTSSTPNIQNHICMLLLFVIRLFSDNPNIADHFHLHFATI